MIRFYRNIGAAGMGVFVALILLMSAIGSTQPIHPALRGFIEGCEGIPQPCWYGIVPGYTSLVEGLTIVETLEFPRSVGEEFNNSIIFRSIETYQLILNYVYHPDWQENIIIDVIVQPKDDLTLGSVLMTFKSPFSLLLSPYGDTFVQPYIGIQLRNGNVISPYSRVSYIQLGQVYAPVHALEWRGFTTRNFYCQLTPTDCE
jgi:hypothetical protein